MYTMNSIEMVRQHHNEMIRESENERLARRLKAGRPGISSRIKNALFGLIHLSPTEEAAQY